MGKVIHGLSSHPLYGIWNAMIGRCERPSSCTPASFWARYGGRGIAVCPEWHDVAVFIAWIEENLGPRSAGMTLDRWPDKDGNYEPGNVRWATRSQQAQNRAPYTRAPLKEPDPVMLAMAQRDMWAQDGAFARAALYGLAED